MEARHTPQGQLLARVTGTVTVTGLRVDSALQSLFGGALSTCKWRDAPCGHGMLAAASCVLPVSQRHRLLVLPGKPFG